VEDEELQDLIFDSNAYEMLHRAKVEWPCLSLDILLPERWNEPSKFSQEWFPHHVSALDPKTSHVSEEDD